MASLSSPTALERRPAQAANRAGRAKRDVLLVVGLGNPVAADYAAYASREGVRAVAVAEGISRAELQAAIEEAGVEGIVVFLNGRLSLRDRSALDEILAVAGERSAKFVGIVSSFRAHFGDPESLESEAYALSRVRGLRARTVVFRPGHILSASAPAARRLRRFGPCYPLVPRRLRGCCVNGEELSAAIESERHARRPLRGGLCTLLGPNRPWRELLAQHRVRGVLPAVMTAVSALLALLLLGHVAALVLGLLARRRPSLRAWNFDTLRPRSLPELLALYNRHNYQHVKVVGYNNGVIHFGHRYPGKTVVSTVHCNRVSRVSQDEIRADCGATIRRAMDFLAQSGQELYVIPNYSYVCLGTAFFIPIHGSAVDYSTVAETITRVVLYDPVRDHLIAATRDEPAFREALYNLDAPVLLLWLHIRAKPKSHYYVHQEELENPESGQLLAILRDQRATNVEIRKSSAAGSGVRIARYYKDPGDAQSPVLDVPRDALGRLWDRLEENAVTSFVMHALTRYFAWHVELFFTDEEFATFWQGHRALPLKKIQLRHIRRDGFPNSPFREHDCVSADMFMLRRHRRRFEAYLKRTFAVVRSNPGKHSR